ncbi:MAG: hypothetical protein FJ214_03935 [Ignavibacteria bacterium]|nr:hypothetical protein [Ignavibacteria bacterium]
MKKFSLLFLFLLIISKFSLAQDKGNGLGIILGEPTGISGKYWLDNTKAIDFGLAYSFVSKNSALSLHADYLYHAFDVIKSTERFPIYYGFGARLRLVNGAENMLGARGVIGIAWLSSKIPIDAFIELVPVFNLFPSTSLNLDLAIGSRYFFN